MPWGVAAAAVGAAGSMAASSMGKGKGASQETSNEPWAQQQSHLTTAFDAAKNNYNLGQGRGVYEGDRIAAPGQGTRDGVSYLNNYSNGTGAALTDQVASASSGLLGALPQYQQNAANLAANGAGALNGTAQNTLTNAANGQPMSTMSGTGIAGQGAQTGAVNNAQGILAGAAGNTDASLREAALGYVNSDVVQGTVDASLRDVSRTLHENTLPTLNARASAGGNLNSARAGAAEAVATRAADDRAADVASGIRQDAYNTGLQTAMANRTQNDATALAANQQIGGLGTSMANTGEQARQFDANQVTGAASQLGSLDLQNRQLGAQTQLAGNQQLGNAGQMGIAGATAASGLADANGGRLLTSGAAEQAANQTDLDRAYEQWNREYATNKEQIGDYWSIVGDKNWGSSGSTQNTAASNPMGSLLGGASAGVGLYNAAGGSTGISNAWNSAFGTSGGTKSTYI